MSKNLDELMEDARKRPPMTWLERKTQSIDAAHALIARTER